MSDKSFLSIEAELKAQGCTNLRLRQLMRRVAQLYDLEMAKAGLKTTQYSLLSHVLKLGPLRPGELAQSMKFSASTLTRNLKPLIDAGWVELAAGCYGLRDVTRGDLGRPVLGGFLAGLLKIIPAEESSHSEADQYHDPNHPFHSIFLQSPNPTIK